MRDKDLVRFIKEREAVRINKEAGKPRPWTKDVILDRYRFCNVHREDDAVTRHIRLWGKEYEPNPDLWFAFVVARLFNNPVTLDAIAGTVLPFKPDKMRTQLQRMKGLGAKIFNAAYIVSTNGIPMDKVEYLIERVLKPLWAARKELRPGEDEPLEQYHARLMRYDGLGSFLAAQVIADLKYHPPMCDYLAGELTTYVPDWHTFAASGPGSRRGLNRVMGRDKDAPWNERKWREAIADLYDLVRRQLPANMQRRFHAQDLQNCLCEFDKYERARTGDGVPKQIYKEKN